uniref:Ovule protein n=1 Tax=Panagrolaimus sp. JU765 TaxID=591449 RepID=A0AC34QZ87_9BILA
MKHFVGFKTFHASQLLSSPIFCLLASPETVLKQKSRLKFGAFHNPRNLTLFFAFEKNPKGWFNLFFLLLVAIVSLL